MTPEFGRAIGFLGGGNMGRALVAALLRSGVERARLRVAEPQDTTARALAADFGIVVTADAGAFLEDIDVLVLAIKPQDMAQVLQPLRATLQRLRPLVISVAAGLGTAQLQRWCGAGVPLVRAMPNRPALDGAGATGLYAATTVDAAARQRAAAIMSTAGIVVWVDEEAQMDVVTAVSGSGPAYFFRFAEALAAAGSAQGLPPAVATQLARATLHGAGAMAVADADLAALRQSVTSRGGTTAAALAAFDSAGLERVVTAAVEAAVTRGRQLAAEAADGA
jgi:pyrroline-5-carboxylate reductase